MKSNFKQRKSTSERPKVIMEFAEKWYDKSTRQIRFDSGSQLVNFVRVILNA